MHRALRNDRRRIASSIYGTPCEMPSKGQARNDPSLHFIIRDVL